MTFYPTMSWPTQISGTLHNTGQSLVFRVESDSKLSVNISGGPLAYRYQFEEIYIHYGVENSQGSEHQIQGYKFPGEVSCLSTSIHRLVITGVSLKTEKEYKAGHFSLMAN